MSQIEEVATRLKGLRDALGLTIDEIAAVCGVDVTTYEKYESAEADIPISTIQKIANAYGIEIMALLFGEEPKMRSYFVTRRGTGASVERRSWYKYQSLAAGFSGRSIEPFLVTVEPSTDGVHLSSHDGQEFNYIESGTMELHIDGKTITLNAGDTIIYDARHPHGMKAIGDQPLRFIAIIC